MALQYNSTTRGLTVHVVGMEAITVPLPTGAATSAKQSILAAFASNTIDDYTTTSVTYFCKEKDDGTWLISKIDETGNYPVFTYATVTNNPTVTSYADAFTARVTLTYGTFNQAF